MNYEMDDILWDAYGEFVMANVDMLASEGIYICDGDMLTEAMESGILMEEFIATLQSRTATIH